MADQWLSSGYLNEIWLVGVELMAYFNINYNTV